MKIPLKFETVKMPNPFDINSYVSSVRNSFPTSLDTRFRRGKVRDVYDLDSTLLLFHTDRISAFDTVFKEVIPFKGIYLNLLSIYWFKKSRDIFPNHLIKMVDDRSVEVIKTKRIDIEWIVRGYLYGSAWRLYKKGVRVISGVKLPNGLVLGEKLSEPILTPTTKSEHGHDIEITREEAVSRKLIDTGEWAELEEACFKLYNFYSKEAMKRKIIIADVKFEFGRYKEGLIQIDEAPTHDSARLWPLKYYSPGKFQEARCLDKEFLRSYLLNIGYKGNNPPPHLPWPLIRQIALRVKGAYEVLTGKKTVDDLNLMDLDKLFEVLRR